MGSYKLFLHKLLYIMGREIRNPLMKFHEKELANTNFATIGELKELQTFRLRKLLNHARENCEYYEDKLNDIDIDTIGIENITKIPVLTKDMFRTHIHKIQNYALKQKYFKSSTSGSSGEALTFDRNGSWDAATRAAQHRGYSWYGVKPWMKNIYFWGFNPDVKQLRKIRLLDALVNRFRLFLLSDKEVLNAEKVLPHCSYIEGYSSTIFTLAQKLAEKSKQYHNILMVKGTSEKIFDAYHKPVKSVLGKRMISEYGAAETGIIAFECPEGNMHINMENVIVEEVNNKIIVTNLFSYSAPIIRYELGDYIEFDRITKCSCGRPHYIIKEVTGRIGKNIVGYNREFPSLTLYYVFKNITIEHNIVISYSALQKVKGKLQITVLYTGKDKEEVLKLIESESVKYFENDIDVSVTITDRVLHANKKTQSFESLLV